jgi:uroporphyrinogen decarboxylase
VVGGLGEGHTLLAGPLDAVTVEVRDAIAQTGGRGVILGPGCVLPLATPEEHLRAVIAAVRAAA